MDNVVSFSLIQLINVVLSTIKSVITIKGKPLIAGIINALYFALYYYIIKLVTSESLIVVVIVSFFTNLIGVPLGRIIIDKTEKDKLWIYTGFIRVNEEYAKLVKKMFEDNGCYCVYEEIKFDKFYNFKIFSNKKKKSRYIESKLAGLNAKYYITESRNAEVD